MASFILAILVSSLCYHIVVFILILGDYLEETNIK